MSKIYFLAAAAIGAFAFSGSSAQAQYRMPPAQSLSGSCENVETLQSGYVTAVCRDDRGQYRWSSIYYPYCRTDLSNRDGILSCVGATATGGAYVRSQSQTQVSPVGAILGAIAGVIGGGNDDRPLYSPGAQYPTWGQSGYGDPRNDPRYGNQGWGSGWQGQWVPISRRRAWFEQRIINGERQGTITRVERVSLQREFSNLVTLENRYGRNGLSNQERIYLDRRFDQLGVRVTRENRDRDTIWANINSRQANLDARIDAGLRDRSLTPREAASLRSDFNELARLEANYRQGGLTNNERADLDRRFDQLSARIRSNRADDQTGWANINSRQANLDARIDAGVRDRSLTLREAVSLRSDFNELAQLEANYRQGGLTNMERADLDRRFDQLSARIQSDRADDQMGWANINSRQANLDARIDAGLRDRSLTPREAASLRSDFNALAQLEANYRQGGLTNNERADLDRRFDQLSARIQSARRDR